MDDAFSQLTSKEIKIITLFEFSADLKKENQRDKLCDMISKKRYFYSEAGLSYEKAFLEYTESGKSPVNCVFCDNQLDSDELFICGKCKSRVEDAAKDKDKFSEKKLKSEKKLIKKKIRIEKKNRKREEQLKKPKNNLLLGIIIGIVLAVLAIGLLFLWLRSLAGKPVQKADISDVSKLYEANIGEYGYSIGECTLAEDNSIVYEILPQHDAFIVYPDDNNKLEGASLVLAGDDEESKVRQMLLISVLNMTIYTDEDSSAMMDKISEMIAAGGEYQYRGYKWNMVPVGGNTYYFVVRDEGNIKEDTFVASSTDNDLTFLMGLDFSVAEQILGESVPIISENTRYFEKSGISIVYDDSGRIIYIDQDGTGTDGLNYGLYAVYIGMSKEQVGKIFDELGFGAKNVESDVWAVDIESDVIKEELSIEFENDKAVLITLKIVN